MIQSYIYDCRWLVHRLYRRDSVGVFRYSKDHHPVLKDIDLNVPKAKVTIVTGPVGSRKSTLLKAILSELQAVTILTSTRSQPQ